VPSAAATGAELWHTFVHGWTLAGAMSSRYLLVAGKAGRALTLIRQSDGGIVWQRPYVSVADALAISPDERSFFYGVAVSTALSLVQFDERGRLDWVAADERFNQARAAAYSPDGDYLLVIATDNERDRAQLYDRAGDLLWSTPLPGKPVPAAEAGFAAVSAGAAQLMIGDPVTGRVFAFRRTQ
jgi:PQQ-like domain